MRHPLLKIMQLNVIASLALASATALPSSALAQGSLEFGPVVRQQAPAVVTIFENGGEVGNVPKMSAPDGDQTVADGEEDKVLGSGFLISPEGFIVTSNDVIENAEDFQVGLADSNEPAKLVGRDSQSGIAVLKIDFRPGMSATTWGDSDKVRVGDWALSIGKGLRSGTIAALGIVSARSPGAYRDVMR
jgi:S1-C subfamily serine protease